MTKHPSGRVLSIFLNSVNAPVIERGSSLSLMGETLCPFDNVPDVCDLVKYREYGVRLRVDCASGKYPPARIQSQLSDGSRQAYSSCFWALISSNVSAKSERSDIVPGQSVRRCCLDSTAS